MSVPEKITHNIQPDNGDFYLRFAVASDGHWGDSNDAPGIDGRYGEARHELLINFLNQEEQLDFMIYNGDIIRDQPHVLPWVRDKFINEANFPVFFVYGNHERATHEQWKNIFSYPWNAHFEIGDYAFILATTATETGTYICPDSVWIQDKLSYYSDKKGVFVATHISTYTTDWHVGLECNDVTEVYENTNNLVAVLHGHNHRDGDDHRPRGGVDYFFDGVFARQVISEIPSLNSPPWGYHGYRIFEIKKNGVISSYQLNMTDTADVTIGEQGIKKPVVMKSRVVSKAPDVTNKANVFMYSKEEVTVPSVVNSQDEFKVLG